MNIIYMGTPEFAAAPLKMLWEAGHTLSLVVTQPDRARDRGKKVAATPVKALAEELGLVVAQPERLRDNKEFLERMKALEPDLAVVAAYGKLLPPELLQIPRLGCVNIHASLLPKYRGAAPIQRCLLSGDPVTGVTLMYMAEGMDTGDIIAAAETETAGKTSGDLHEELSLLGGQLLLETLPALAAGTAARIPQKEEEASFAPMVSKEEGKVDFRRSAAEIERQIRAFQPWPGAAAVYKGKPLKLLRASVVELIGGRSAEAPVPGTVLAADGAGVHIAAGSGVLVVTRLQAPGKRAMDAGEYLRGNPVEPGSQFE
ncbi:MAG: methionyl-tRNA formyltransferase [Bacillota bacterium]|nr:methionyl-tRNA formyltransferase [Bacillota bacterium]